MQQTCSKPDRHWDESFSCKNRFVQYALFSSSVVALWTAGTSAPQVTHWVHKGSSSRLSTIAGWRRTDSTRLELTAYFTASRQTVAFILPSYLSSLECAGNRRPVWPPRLSSWHRGWPPPGICQCFSCSGFSCCQTSWRPGGKKIK